MTEIIILTKYSLLNVNKCPALSKSDYESKKIIAE
jgi:hypothetical protein